MGINVIKRFLSVPNCYKVSRNSGIYDHLSYKRECFIFITKYDTVMYHILQILSFNLNINLIFQNVLIQFQIRH